MFYLYFYYNLFFIFVKIFLKSHDILFFLCFHDSVSLISYNTIIHPIFKKVHSKNGSEHRQNGHTLYFNTSSH